MFSRKKIAAVSGLMVGLAMTCAGVAQADNADPTGCVMDYQGNVICVHEYSTNYTSKDGRDIVQQTQDCSTTYRQPGEGAWPQVGALQSAATSLTQTGPTVNCDNTAPRL
jgi:hypothetical protein